MTEVMIGATPNDTQTNQPTASPADHALRREHLYIQVHPGHIPNDNKAILTVPLVLLVLSVIVVGLRIWTRARMVKFFGMDDWWILGATTTHIAGTILSVAGTFRGEGSHINDVDDDLTYILKLLYAEIVLQPVTLNLIKLSILFFYLRLPGSNRFLILTRLTVALIAAMMVSFTLALALACIPVSKQWDVFETRGGCVDRALLWHIILGFNVATNIWILVLPARMLLGLKVDRRKKRMVLCIFGCGSLATIASLLALIELPLAINDPDKTWGSWHLAVYTAVENSLGIIAASTPALKPLLGKTARVVRGTVGSKLKSTRWAYSRETGSGGGGVGGGTGGGGEFNVSSRENKPKPLSASARIITNSTSQSETRHQPLEDAEKKHGFGISEVVKKIISPRGSLASGGRSSASRTGSSSFHTALGSRSHRESAVLDTIGVLPTQGAFPKNTSGSRRATRVFAGGDFSRPEEIHHIRDWQLDQNDYCLDPNVEHNLPQRPKRTYNRISIDSSAGVDNGNGGGPRRISQTNSIGSAVSPTDLGRRRTLETCGEDNSNETDEGAKLTIESILSHEEWKKSGGYV